MGLITEYNDVNFKQRVDIDGDPVVSQAAAQSLTNKTVVGQKETVHIPVSFETGEQGVLSIFFPYAVRINKVRSIVRKALAGTDAGTISLSSDAGSLNAVITHAASAAFGNQQSATPTQNRDLAADTHVFVTSAKTTAGGKAIYTIEFERL